MNTSHNVQGFAWLCFAQSGSAWLWCVAGLSVSCLPFSTDHERKTLNAFFSKPAFCNSDLWNAIPRRRIELLRQFFPDYSSFSPLCDAKNISKSYFLTLRMDSQIVWQVWKIFHLFSGKIFKFLPKLTENLLKYHKFYQTFHKNSAKFLKFLTLMGFLLSQNWKVSIYIFVLDDAPALLKFFFLPVLSFNILVCY